jgi:hypothetical protein
MAIRVIRNDAGNCVNFLGSSNPVYWNACLSAEVDSTYSDRINVINDIRTVIEGDNVYEFFQVPYTDFSESDGTVFTSATDAAEYITTQCNVASNTGSFVLSDTDTLDFSVDSTSTTVLLANGDAYAVNSIQAVANDDNHIDIVKHTSGTVLYKDLRVANARIDGITVTQTLATAVNELNSLFTNTASSSGTAPSITSNTTINLTAGETLNYELTATNGVAYEWSGLPSGIATVDGNVRKLIGGSSLAIGSYTITAKAINYYGEDTQTLTLNVAAPPYSNTKSVEFENQDYLGANAALLDDVLGRNGNGSGSGDAWTIHIWYKPDNFNSGQTIFYFGDSDVTNGGHLEVRTTTSGNLRFTYGSSNNYIRRTTNNQPFSTGTWYNIIITYNGGTTGASSADVSDYYSRFNIYINGNAASLANAHGNYGWSGQIDGENFRVGRYASGNYINGGRVDEIAVWDSNETSNVSSIYNGGTTHDLSQLTSTPSHWWRMGDGDTYSNIQDNVGNATFVMYNMTAANIVTDAP